jgi:hypothetical protein
MTPRQLTMFGVPAEPETTFHIYHDESGTFVPRTADTPMNTDPNHRWLVHGVLFIPTHRIPATITLLQQARDATKHTGEVHFVGLRRTVKGTLAQCTQHWLDLYLTQLSEWCHFHALAVDTFSAGFRHEKFRQAHIAYNYWAKVAMIAGISWSLKAYPRVAVRFFSDRKYRKHIDNFRTYIPKEVAKSIAQKRVQKPLHYPKLRLLDHEVALTTSDPSYATPDTYADTELIQLVDLLTSGIVQALSLRSQQRAKVVMGEILADWIEDTRLPPWLQSQDLHRHFSLSCFPNRKGEFHDPNLATSNRKQLTLF